MTISAKGVTVYWIERATSEVRSHYFASPLPAGHSYQGEVRIKHALDATDLVVIPLASAATNWAKETRERLQATADGLKRECVG
jgi:hypothetical protein